MDVTTRPSFTGRSVQSRPSRLPVELEKWQTTLDNGNTEETDQAFIELLIFCEGKTLPDLIKQNAQSLVLKYLQKLLPNAGITLPPAGDVSSIGRFVLQSLQLLIEKFKHGQSLLYSNPLHSDFTENPDQTDVIKGVTILEELSKPGHPLAVEAKSILDTWLGDMTNRCWLITQYGLSATRGFWTNEGYFYADNDQHQQYKTKFNEQVNICFGQIRAYEYQGNKDAAQRLVYQLIEVAIALEHLDIKYPMQEFCSSFYQRLSASLASDDPLQQELRIRKCICDKERVLKSDLDCLKAAADTPGRPNAAYEYGKRDFSIIFSNKKPTSIFYEYEALQIKTAIYYFKKAAEEKCLLLNDELSKLTSIVNATFNQAVKYQALGILDEKYLTQALHLYKLADIAGHAQARLESLTLLASKNNGEAKFELGQLYLTGSKTPYIERNIVKAQKLLVAAAQLGHQGAKDLLRTEQAKTFIQNRLYEIGARSEFDAEEIVDKSKPEEKTATQKRAQFLKEMNEFAQVEEGSVGDELFAFRNVYAPFDNL
jgi:hypothetical protein